MVGVNLTAGGGAAVELAVEFGGNSSDEVQQVLLNQTFQWSSTRSPAGNLLGPAVLTRLEAVAGAEEETQPLEMETLRSEVGEEATVVVVLTELAAADQVRHLGEEGEEALWADIAALLLQPAGVGGELSLDQDQDQGGDQECQQCRHHARTTTEC